MRAIRVLPKVARLNSGPVTKILVRGDQNFGPTMDQFSMEFWSGGTIFFRENWSGGPFLSGKIGPGGTIFFMENWSGGVTIFFREYWSGRTIFFQGILVRGIIFFMENWSCETIFFREYWPGDHFFQKKMSGRLILSLKIRFYQSFDILDFYTFNCRSCLTPD